MLSIILILVVVNMILGFLWVRGINRGLHVIGDALAEIKEKTDKLGTFNYK